MAYPPPPYADAICGEFVCGEAICGPLWAYPSSAGLQIVGTEPALLVGTGVSPPQAKLTLAAIPVDSQLSPLVEVGQASLSLLADAPILLLSQSLSAPTGGLYLDVLEPDYVGVVWITPAPEIDLDLSTVACTEIVLAPSACTDIVLEPAGER